MYIGEYMHTNIVTITSDMRVREAQRIMDKHLIRRLPVVDKGKLVGLLTRSKIRETTGHHATSLSMWELNYLLEKMKVKEIMETHLYTVTPDTPLEKIVEESQKRETGTVLIVGKDMPNKLVGIATTTDLYKAAASILGFDRLGVRLRICHPEAVDALAVMRIIVKYDVALRSVYHFPRPETLHEDLIVYLANNNIHGIEDDLINQGYEVEVTRSTYMKKEVSVV